MNWTQEKLQNLTSESMADFWEALDCSETNCGFPHCSQNGGPCSKDRLKKENQ